MIQLDRYQHCTLSTMTWNQGWKMKTVESRIAFSRFIFEDAEQCALQGGEETSEDTTRNSRSKTGQNGQNFPNIFLMRRKIPWYEIRWNKQSRGIGKCCIPLLVSHHLERKCSLSLCKRHWTWADPCGLNLLNFHKPCWQVFSWFILRVLHSLTSCLDKVLLRQCERFKDFHGSGWYSKSAKMMCKSGWIRWRKLKLIWLEIE